VTPDQRRDHVLDIADELGVMLIVDRTGPCGGRKCPDPHGYAYPRSRPWPGAPFMPPIIVVSHDPGSSVLAYIVALHELGHTVDRSTRMLDREAAAWRWAIRESGEEIDWEGLYERLVTYRDCGRCKPSTAYNRLLREAERRAG
jgi:hypothetical protein